MQMVTACPTLVRCCACSSLGCVCVCCVASAFVIAAFCATPESVLEHSLSQTAGQHALAEFAVTPAPQSLWCNASLCTPSMQGDGWCHTDCNTEACGQDGGDCTWCEGGYTGPSFVCYSLFNSRVGGNVPGPNCIGGCPWVAVGNGQCEQRCFLQKVLRAKQIAAAACYPLVLTKPCTVVSDTPSQCFLDFGDCTMHAPSELRCDGNCPVARHGDGMCDEECNNVACEFDAGDCQPPGLLPPLQKPLPPSCAPGCTAAMTQVVVGVVESRPAASI